VLKVKAIFRRLFPRRSRNSRELRRGHVIANAEEATQAYQSQRTIGSPVKLASRRSKLKSHDLGSLRKFRRLVQQLRGSFPSLWTPANFSLCSVKEGGYTNPAKRLIAKLRAIRHIERRSKLPFRRSALNHAALRSNDFTSPPTYDFTSICSIFSDTTSVGSSRTGGKCSRSMCARRLL
jgi:hypothetical protein